MNSKLTKDSVYDELIQTHLYHTHFIASWSAYYLYEQSADEVDQVAPSLEAPLFTGQRLTNTSYDIEGLRNYKMYAVSLEHFAQDGHTVFHQPKLIVYREGNTEEWVVTSDTAVLSKDHILTLQKMLWLVMSSKGRALIG